MRAVSPRLPRHPDPDEAVVETLHNGVRVAVFREPRMATAAISVFVRAGSDHESARLNGVGHVIEHMAFKGTRTRDCQQVNLDAERLGADVDAHTDKDHTAFHMRGLAGDAASLVAMLGDIVTRCSFPEPELERERQVLLQEFAEDDDDPVSTAYKRFDRACYGEHPAGQPVIGTRANLRRFTRSDLVAHVARLYAGANTVVAVGGDVDPVAIVRAAARAFDARPPAGGGARSPPAGVGGVRARRLPGCSQAHVIAGYPIPPRSGDYEPFAVAAAVFGRGMSSPLLDELRERRGIVYHADCSADVRDTCGQLVIEASMAPGAVRSYAAEVSRMLRDHAATIDPSAVQRARNQIRVAVARDHESAPERLERAALDLFSYGRILSFDEHMDRIAQVTPDQVRDAFARMLRAPAAVAVAGAYGRGEEHRVAQLLPGARAACSAIGT
ncbi:MAG: insulinase family protein [Burkholderiales bacterium]|nr:insulinase family protein [Burkholderiales bacterium]